MMDAPGTLGTVGGDQASPGVPPRWTTMEWHRVAATPPAPPPPTTTTTTTTTTGSTVRTTRVGSGVWASLGMMDVMTVSVAQVEGWFVQRNTAPRTPTSAPASTPSMAGTHMLGTGMSPATRGTNHSVMWIVTQTAGIKRFGGESAPRKLLVMTLLLLLGFLQTTIRTQLDYEIYTL